MTMFYILAGEFSLHALEQNPVALHNDTIIHYPCKIKRSSFLLFNFFLNKSHIIYSCGERLSLSTVPLYRYLARESHRQHDFDALSIGRNPEVRTHCTIASANAGRMSLSLDNSTPEPIINDIAGRRSILATLKHPRDDPRLASPLQGMETPRSLQILGQEKMISRPMVRGKRRSVV